MESKKGHHLFTQQQNVSLLQSIADQKKSTLDKLEIIKQIKLKLLEAQQEIEKVELDIFSEKNVRLQKVAREIFGSEVDIDDPKFLPTLEPMWKQLMNLSAYEVLNTNILLKPELAQIPPKIRIRLSEKVRSLAGKEQIVPAQDISVREFLTKTLL